MIDRTATARPAAADEAAVEVFDKLVEEITQKLHAGQPVDLDDHARRYPDCAERLRKLLPTLEAMAGLGHTLSEGDAPGPGEARGTLGDFRILREIGRGGMGVVYEAEQISLGRRVALKVLPYAAMLDARHLQRFHNEARAAASLHHPNIVPIHAVGCERGVHYYAMQYIEGQTLAGVIHDLRQTSPPLTKGGLDAVGHVSNVPTQAETGHVENVPHETATGGQAASDTVRAVQAAVSTERSTRLPAYFRNVAQLGIQAAEALDHAHQQGVVHRDIKPSNLILDHQGKLWVTDFGLAHIESGAELTMTGDLIGTLRYMSPEQALAKRVVIDHRTDVYSLGATLYELLTLEPPFSGSDRQELLRQIAFEEPRAPRRLNKSVPAELETIVQKAMAKNPSERYATAQELADDLRRYLEDKPIRARRPTLAQQASKWSRRHLPVVWSAVVVLILATMGSVVTTALVWRAKAAALLALGRERDALEKFKAQLQETEDSIDKYVETVRNAELLADERFKPVLKKLLKEALAHYQRYIEQHQHEHDTATRAKMARALFEVGRINGIGGDQSEAIAAYEQALAIRERLVRENPTGTEYQNDLASSHGNIGNLYSATGKPAEALAAYEKALAIFERLALENPTVTQYQNDLASSHGNIGNLYSATGKPAEALAAYEKALAIFERLALENPTVTQYQNDLANSHQGIGLLNSNTGKPAEALAAYEKALTIQERLARENPAVTQYQNDLAGSHNNIGNLYSATGKPADALAAHEKALAIFERLARENPTVTQYRADVARSHNNIANRYLATGKPAEALAAYEKALAIFERLVRENPTVTHYQRLLAASHHNIAFINSHTGKPAEALAACEKAFAIFERLMRENPTVTQYQSDLASSHNYIGGLYSATGKPAEALAWYEKALAIMERLARENPTVTEYQSKLALSHNSIGLFCYSATGKRAEALAAHETALAIYERLARENPTVTEYQSKLALSHNSIGVLYKDTGKPAEALAAYERALAIRERLARENPTVTEYQKDLAGSHNNIGILYSATGKPAEALAAYEKALAIQERLARENPTVTEYQIHLAGSYVNIASLTREVDPEAAAQRLAKAIELLQGVLRHEPRQPTARLFLRNAHIERAKLRATSGEFAQALRDWERAIELDEGAGRSFFRMQRASCLARLEPPRAVAEAEELARGDKVDATVLYNAACVCSLAAANVKDEPSRAKYAAQAMDFLRQAVARGFKDAQHIKQDPDLTALREREDFRKLVGELEAAAATINSQGRKAP